MVIVIIKTSSSSSDKLPTSTESRRHQVNVITIRSEKVLKDPPLPTNDVVLEEDRKNEHETKNDEEVEENKKTLLYKWSFAYVVADNMCPYYYRRVWNRDTKKSTLCVCS